MSSDTPDAWYEPYYASDDSSQHTTTTSPTISPGIYTGSSDDDTDESDGDDTTEDTSEYECTVCGWETDIDNEHKARPEHWCHDCNSIRRFQRTNDA